MKMNRIYLLVVFCASFYIRACGQPAHVTENTEGGDIVNRFHPPEGYVRKSYDKNTFEWYLAHLPLKPSGTRVHYFDGREKPNTRVAAAVIDMEIGKRDLQQCADAVIRLRAEYLYQQKSYSLIHFNFTSGFKADYVRWAEGNRINVNGNRVSWYESGKPDYSYPAFRRYLDIVFAYAGTLSLSKELKAVSCNDIRIGDVWIQGGSPGHAVIVVDMAVHQDNGRKVFMLAQSYMPAQDIHILNNPNNGTISPWYELSCDGALHTPEWTFHPTDLKRFN